MLNLKMNILKICVISLVVSITLGLLVGTSYSHGFDIPWWIFSILFFVMIAVPCLIILGLVHYRLNKKLINK